MEESVAGLDVREEGVTQALSLGGALHQAGDVHHVEESRHFAAKKERGKHHYMSIGWNGTPITHRQSQSSFVDHHSKKGEFNASVQVTNYRSRSYPNERGRTDRSQNICSLSLFL